jgi:hypothetical protein
MRLIYMHDFVISDVESWLPVSVVTIFLGPKTIIFLSGHLAGQKMNSTL